MRIGIKFPTREIGSDIGLIREWALTARDAGFDHMMVIDHVLGVDPSKREGYSEQFSSVTKRKPYDHRDEFHEPLTMMAYFSALAPKMELATGVVISPQRQTALLAKQAVQIDVVTGGNVRFAFGVGWNSIEYEALGQDFTKRGRKLDEQIETLRALWTQETVEIDGKFDHLMGVGLAPAAIQRPIPIWLGGWSAPALKRCGRVSDGWFHGLEPDEGFERNLDIVRTAAEEVGRPGESVPFEGGVEMRYGIETADERLAWWQERGASHVTVDPMLSGFSGSDHVAFLEQIADKLSPFLKAPSPAR